MFNIVLICGENYSTDINGYHHYGFWKKALENHPNINLIHWYPWNNWRNMPTQNIDLYFFLDFRYDLWDLANYDKFHPRILYWWDAFHSMFSLVAQIPLVFDKVYISEYLDVQHLKMCGFNNVEWLSGSFCPDLYKPLNSSKQYDLGFVGQLDNSVVRKKMTRKGLIQGLAQEFNSSIVKDIRGPAVNELYNKSKIMIERTIFFNTGTRLFETVGSGGFSLINKSFCYNGLDQLGTDGTHFVTYDDSLEDAKDKMRYYIKHDTAREKIAMAGYTHFINNHTYKHRLDKILKDFS